MKILFLVPYPTDQSPSQRFRFEQYLIMLEGAGYHIHTQSFLPAGSWKVFYSSGHHLQKLILLIAGFTRRVYQLIQCKDYHYIFIHREAAPLGPPVFEWAIAKIFRKKIIYDFDDAIWLTDKTGEPTWERFIRCRSKVAKICRWSHKVSCGNPYLARYARQFNANVVINPTTIDTINQHNPALFDKSFLKSKNQITGRVIGWTGSHSTLKYLENLYPVLFKLFGLHPNVCLLVIADQPPAFELKNLLFKKWSKETEVADLMLADIGIMPLPDDEWAKGKCGFKALQYLALQIPCVASPVGVNPAMVKTGETGFLAASRDEWLACLDALIQDEGLRGKMGVAGRKLVEKNYSVAANTANFLSLFT